MSSDHAIADEPKSRIVPLPWLTVLLDVFITLLIPNSLLYWNLSYSKPRSLPGFFCNDFSIRLPHREDTVSMTLLASYEYFAPVFVIILVELFNMYRRRDEIYFKYEKNRPIYQRFIIRFCGFYRYAYLSYAIQLVVFIFSRHFVGRMRPNYLDLCKPSVGYRKCNTLDYITNYTCTNGKSLELMDSQRQSFFSGHASISAATSTYLIFYLQHRLKPHITAFSLVPWIQMIFVFIAMFMSFTRVSDNAHHMSDVLVGIFVGVVAVIGVL
ncbi:PAP2 family protein [Aphelenchoides besseyi]|nr:PAP2 family protein [Aphelenchoides besseyi]